MAVDVVVTFPTLGRVVGATVIGDKVREMEHAYRHHRSDIVEPRKHHSRGFWNTVAIASLEDNDDLLQSALFRLRLIEQGLEQASRCGKELKYRPVLTRDDEGFQQALAELHVLRCLGPLGMGIDIELPGSTPTRNYDLLLRTDAGDVHLDCKWRTATPLGEVAPSDVIDVQELLGHTFDAFCYAVLRTNVLGDSRTIEVACLVDEARKVVRGISPSGTRLTADTASHYLEGQALNMGLHALLLGDPVFAIDLNGASAAYVPSCRTLFLDHPVIDHVEFSETLAVAGQPGSCILIPHSETQAVFSREAREEWGNASSAAEHDVDVPEHRRIADLISGVYQQLPTNPFNVVCLGVEDHTDFDDVEIAVLGELSPITNSGGRIERRRGLFQESAFRTVAGVLAFTLYPPTVPFSGAPQQHAQFWANPSTPEAMPTSLAQQLRDALSRSEPT